jgi:long-chain acyl-CoA synthetase
MKLAAFILAEAQSPRAGVAIGKMARDVETDVPDDTWGESVKAVVVIKPGGKVTEEEIIGLCKENLAGYKKPKSVDFVASIPKTAIGKILRREVKAKYWTGKDKKIG